MLREDGFVMGFHNYFVMTTTASAAEALAHAERPVRTAWTDLRVHLISVMGQWTAVA